MEASFNKARPRLHPMLVAAAASVTVVSLLGAAAITGIFPSHSNATPAPLTAAAQNPETGLPANVAQSPLAVTVPVQATATRFQTADGRVFEEVPLRSSGLTAAQAAPRTTVEVQRPVHYVAPRKVVHHYAQNTAAQPAYVQQQAYSPQHPVRNYVSDMNPVGTGMGAVVGGLLGNQVGGGNGKKIATVAGVLLGGYAGNEVAHDRNPLPFSNR